MAVGLSFIICLALVVELVIPAILRSYRSSENKRHEELFLTKLRIVRRYYPELNDATYSEIMAEYNVEALYDNLGRRSLKRLSSMTQPLQPGIRAPAKKSRSSRIAA
jgi:hypothetical protein